LARAVVGEVGVGEGEVGEEKGGGLLAKRQALVRL